MSFNIPFLLDQSLIYKLLSASNATLYTFFKKIATHELFSTKDAIITIGENKHKKYTYSQVLRIVDDAASKISNLELDKNKHHVAMLAPNDFGWVVTTLAIAKLGIPLVCLKTYSAPNLLLSIEMTNVSALIISDECFEIANSVKLSEKFTGKIVWLKQSENSNLRYLKLKKNRNKLTKNIKEYEQLNRKSEREVEQLRLHSSQSAFDHTLWLCFSSGTTGVHKAIVLTNRNIVQNAIISGHIMRYGEASVNGSSHTVFSLFPYFTAGGMVAGVFAALFNGACIICSPGIFSKKGVLHTEHILKMISESKATVLLGTPPLLSSLLEITNRPLLPRLEMAIIGSTWCTSRLFNKLKNELRGDGKSVHMIVIYGQTEAGVITHVNHMKKEDVNEYPNFILPVGEALPGIEAKLLEVDDKGTPLFEKPVADGERGMLMLSGYSVMKGYYNNTGKSEEVLIEHEGNIWLKTDDIFIKKDKMYTCYGRFKEFLPLPGKPSRKILPIEVESFIMHAIHKLKLPIDNVQVVSVTYEQDYVLAACLKGHPLSEKEIFSLKKTVYRIQKNVSSLPLILYYIVIPNYPLNASGKIDRLGIKTMVENKFNNIRS